MSTQKSFFRNNQYRFLLVAVACAGFWQVAFLNDTLKWDILDQYFPNRYFVSECLRNKIFPFWNPYQNWGVANFADPQSAVWHPWVWLISLVHGYDLYASQVDFMFHILLAGLGMYSLILYFSKHEATAFVIASAYMLSGFFVGNAQHLGYIVSGAWIPWVLVYY